MPNAGQSAVKVHSMGRKTSMEDKDYTKMTKAGIIIELAEILPNILEMGDAEKILRTLQRIPLEKYPDSQKEDGLSGKNCICIKKISDSARELKSAIRIIVVTQTGKFVIGRGVAYQEGRIEKKFRDYLNNFAEQFLNS